MSSDISPQVGQTTQGQIDFFICHASEDKASAARPIYDELVSRGHSAWLDEAELTLGDSLRQSIDNGLANCRFGVVILSEAFFRKSWPQYELDGLMDRQMSGTKTILPVWHSIGHADVAARSPSLAGLYAVSTATGVPAVVDEIVRAYVRASVRPERQTPTVESAERPGPDQDTSPATLQFPLTDEGRMRLHSDYPEYWEYFLFADALARGLLVHEPAWKDHQLGLVRPIGRHVTRENVANYTHQACQDLSGITNNVERLLSPAATEAAFGPPGQPGDAEAIEHLCQRLTAVYGQCLEWAAEIRSTRVEEDFKHLFELLLTFANEPIARFRAFVNRCTDELARVPQLLASTDDRPVTITLKLHLTGEGSRFREYEKELRRLRRRRKL